VAVFVSVLCVCPLKTQALRFTDSSVTFRKGQERNNFIFFVYIFICCSFNGAVGNSDCTASNYWMMMNNELEMLWKEAAVAKFELLT
jgi:hypothetical protein